MSILKISSIPSDTRLISVENIRNPKVSMFDKATLLMTDFKTTRVLTISPDKKIDMAVDRMMLHKIRLLFVMDNDAIKGIITSTDILGEKPVLFITNRGISRDEITVADIMTRVDLLEAVDYSELERSKVSDVIETMKEINRQHMLVVESNSSEIRGLLSMTRISEQTGKEIDTDGRANTLVELDSSRKS